MILILGMKHQAMKLYKVCINHDLGMTLTFLRHGQLRPPMHLNGKNRKKCHLKGKTCIKLANGLNLYDLKKKLTPEVALTLTWGYIHNTILVKQVYWYISQVSGERLQDHWSSGYDLMILVLRFYLFQIMQSKFYLLSYISFFFFFFFFYLLLP